jgi:GxxExxY protein
MPVECSVELASVGQERFHAIDKVLMRHAFDIHNTLGRFCDERIYQEELAQRCRASDIEVNREVILRVLHRDFVKLYYLDLLVERGLIYELKAVESLTAIHQKQLINYLLLAGLRHGKLVNFHPRSVQSHFVSTQLSRHDRVAFPLNDGDWQGNDKASQQLRETLHALLEDWGTFLDVNLYREALLHFLDGPEAGVQPVDIEVNGRIVGSQKLCMLNAESAWHLSSVREHLPSYETHITRLLRHTRLERIHWINFDQRWITLKTLKK